MDGSVLLGAIAVIVSIQDTAVVDEARCGIDAADGRPGSTRQSICLEDAAERVLPREVVVKRKKTAVAGLYWQEERKSVNAI